MYRRYNLSIGVPLIRPPRSRTEAVSRFVCHRLVGLQLFLALVRVAHGGLNLQHVLHGVYAAVVLEGKVLVV